MSGRYLLDTNVAIRVLEQEVDLEARRGSGLEAFLCLDLTVVGNLRSRTGGRYQVVLSAQREGQAKDPSPLRVKEVWIDDRRYIVCLTQKQAKKRRCRSPGDPSRARRPPRPGLQGAGGQPRIPALPEAPGGGASPSRLQRIEAKRANDSKWVLRTNTDGELAEVTPFTAQPSRLPTQGTEAAKATPFYRSRPRPPVPRTDRSALRRYGCPPPRSLRVGLRKGYERAWMYFCRYDATVSL